MKSNAHGFVIIEALIIVVVLAVLGFAGYKILHDRSHTSSPVKSEVVWDFDQQSNRWVTSGGTPPACRDPFVFDQSPSDLTSANVIGMPGAYRGFSYKPHGGIRYDGSNGQVEVRMPIDATLVGLTRYYEGNPATLQYVLTFESDCGIAFRFDHLYALTPAFQKIADTTPEPKLNDTKTDPNKNPPRTAFKSGDLVATAVGFPATQNFGYDFGVYDYRQPNAISKNPQWAKLHSTYTAQEWYGVCWLDMLPKSDVARARELAMTILNPAKPNIISDYCPNAPHTTLDFNGGQPTDG